MQKAVRWPCNVCNKGVCNNSIQSISCQKWVCKKCSGLMSGMSKAIVIYMYRVFENVSLQWAEMRMVRWMGYVKVKDRVRSKDLSQRL